MTRPRSQRLLRAAKLARFETDSALRVVREAARALDTASNQLRDLRRFRGDYASVPAPTARASLRGAELMNRCGFVAQIDRAIERKAGEIETCTERWCRAQAAWITSRQHSESLLRLGERQQQAELAEAERADQAEADDQWNSGARVAAHGVPLEASEHGRER